MYFFKFDDCEIERVETDDMDQSQVYFLFKKYDDKKIDDMRKLPHAEMKRLKLMYVLRRKVAHFTRRYTVLTSKDAVKTNNKTIHERS